MKKIKLKLFSILLSLILVMVSVPMAVVAEEVDTSEVSEIVTEIQEGLEDVTISDDFLEIQDDFADINSVASASTSEQITYLPDGIYAFESSRVPGYYMTVSGSGTTANQNIKQSPFAISPSLQYNEYALFKLTRISGTNRYSIRLILNYNLSLTLGANGTDVVTVEIPQNDSDLTQSQTFEILHNSYGYMFRSCETQKFISVNGTSEANLKFSGAVNNSICWIPHGYSTYIEDGVYAFSNNGNLGLWMDTQNNSYLSSKHAQQYAYTTCPADSFSRGGLFKVTQIGTSGRYIIRLMTNNCLTWKCGAVNGDVLSYEIPSNDSNVSVLLTYKIVYDTNGFVLIPFRTTNAITATPNSTASGAGGAPESYLTVTSAFSITDSARWSMYKYTGSIRSGATMISNESTSEMGSKGAIVDSTYTLKMVVWTTELSMNLVSFNISPADTRIADTTTYADTYTADMTVNNVGKLVLYFSLSKFTGSAPMTLYSATYTYNSVPKRGIYYLQNRYSHNYAGIVEGYTQEGSTIFHLGFDVSEQLQWEVEHVSNSGGYIRLKSLYTGKYIGVTPDDITQIGQYSTTDDNTLWRIELLDNYAVKFISKVSESSGKVLVVSLSGIVEGLGLLQREYTNDSEYSDEWFLLNITGSEAFLLGITGDGEDRYTTLGEIMTPLTQLGYRDFNYTITNYISPYDVQEFMSESRVFVFRGHGRYGDIAPYIVLKGTGNIYSEDTLGAFDIYDFDNMTAVVDLSNCDLVLFVGCYTGAQGDCSLPSAAVEAGADVAIGFKDEIPCEDANIWTETFFNAYLSGYLSGYSSRYSIEMAALIAANQCNDVRLQKYLII